MGNKLSKSRFIVLYIIIEKVKNNNLFSKWLNDYETQSHRNISWFSYLAKKLNNYSYILNKKKTNDKELTLYAEYKNHYYANI
jgi:hypothetical protein